MSSKTRKRKKKHDRLVLQLLVIVAVVLVVFEGKLVITMTTHRSAMQASSATVSNNSSAEANADSPESTQSASSSTTSVIGSSSLESTLAGLPSNIKVPGTAVSQSEPARVPTVSNPDSPAIVPEASVAVDNSYFSDAVFIGDSRMEGFRMASGITQGTFFTSIGMSLSSMRSEAIIQSGSESITVAAALSGGKYNKVYIMLGTNDLGEYDWSSFKEGFISVMTRFRELQPDAVFYICSVIYVEESKITDTTYINNTNVDKINSILLEICEEEDLHYLNLNEILSNGYGSLIEGASSDGVHMYETYCKQMLEYMKNHYIAVDNEDTEDSTESDTEADADEDSVSA